LCRKRDSQQQRCDNCESSHGLSPIDVSDDCSQHHNIEGDLLKMLIFFPSSPTSALRGGVNLAHSEVDSAACPVWPDRFGFYPRARAVFLDLRGLPPNFPFSREEIAFRLERTEPRHAGQKETRSMRCFLHLFMTVLLKLVLRFTSLFGRFDQLL
jgi:hypothetical protein